MRAPIHYVAGRAPFIGATFLLAYAALLLLFPARAYGWFAEAFHFDLATRVPLDGWTDTAGRMLLFALAMYALSAAAWFGGALASRILGRRKDAVHERRAEAGETDVADATH